MILTRVKPALAPVRQTIAARPEQQVFMVMCSDAVAFNYRLGLLEKLAAAVLAGKEPPADVVAQLRGMTRTGERA